MTQKIVVPIFLESNSKLYFISDTSKFNVGDSINSLKLGINQKFGFSGGGFEEDDAMNGEYGFSIKETLTLGVFRYIGVDITGTLINS